MASEKLADYYWDIYALIFESNDILVLDDPEFVVVWIHLRVHCWWRNLF